MDEHHVTMDTDFEPATVHIAQNQGRRAFNADAVAHYRRPRTGVLAVSVVDGIGSDADVAELMPLLATAAVRVAARDGARTGVLTATHIAAEPLDQLPAPDGVMVLAVIPPDEPATVAYVGDCRAYGWSDGELHQLTVDHTYGEELRQHGAPEQHAARHDHQVLTTIARATVATVTVITDIPHQRLLLMSDGAAKKLTHEQLAEIARQHEADPQACADAIIAAARAAGSRDDATVAVVTRPASLPVA
jgi:PPM family protein phosphatase